MGIIGSHRKRPEHQDTSLLRGLLLAIFANYTIFGAPEGHLTHVSRPTAMCGRKLLPILDTLVFTDHRKTNPTFREEPSKMVTFHES